MQRRQSQRHIMGYSLRNERYRYTEWELGNEGEELYDYEKYPREVHNGAADPATSGIKAQLRDQLHGIMRQRGAKIPG